MLKTPSRLTLLLLGVLACGGQAAPPGPRSEPRPPTPPLPDGPAATRPLLTAVEPAAWPSQGGIPLELVGQGFAPGARVTFGDVELAAPTYLSSTRLRLPLPPRPGAFGPVPLQVRNPDGQQSPVASLFSFSAAALELPQRSYAAGYRPRALAIADWNGDGQPDLAVAGSESNDITVLFGDGSGGLEAARPVPVGGAPCALVAADFNQDGAADLALLQLASSTLSVLLSDGRGGFLLPQVLTDARIIRPVALAAADLNGDGATDLAAVTVGGADRVWLLFGDGRGRFPRSTLLSTGRDALETRGLALGDA
ncbi:MAG: FG-GAP-like repeat-containing protein [Polyangia bacterium]